MRPIVFAFLFFLSISVFAQKPAKELFPTAETPLDLSPEGEKKFNEDREAYGVILKRLDAGARVEDLSEKEKHLYENFDEMMENYWDIEGDGCSWYCGGGPREVTGSSALSSQGENTYGPKNAHDLNYKTAWVEGASGYGIGEYLRYDFSPESPRINKIIVVNGYVKSQSAWENNSRVKKLRMYLNDMPYAILNLKDERLASAFEIEPIGNANREELKLSQAKPWSIKFEILDIYKGKKYDDVAITEIYFDGLDVHCFAKGTRVTLRGGLTKNIEDIRPGECLFSYDKQAGWRVSTVERVEKVIHHDLIKYTFENGSQIICTPDHPLLSEDNMWLSLRPQQSKQYNGFANVGKLAVNERFSAYSPDGSISTVRLISIEHVKGHYETYTISRMNQGNNFIANGLIAGIEELLPSVRH